MKKGKREQIEKIQWLSPNKALLGVLVFSILLAVTIVACKKDSTSPPQTVEEPTPPSFGNLGESIMTYMFKSVGKGAMGEVGEVGMSWAMSALGLSDGSTDYTDQFNKIDQDLQVIIGELSDIEDELAQVDKELQIIDCHTQQNSLQSQITQIKTVLEDYNVFMSYADSTHQVKDSLIADWVANVRGTPPYSAALGMETILNDFSTALIGVGGDGILPTCIGALTSPASGTFSDEIYYDSVQAFTNFYYYYQVLGLAFLNEALHYEAWVAAGKPNSTTLSADSIAAVCSDPDGEYYCLKAAVATNTVYNDLVNQFTKAGAQFTDDNFLMYNDDDNPGLWVKSLEEFTVANGDNCPDLLTSDKPCGVLASLYTAAPPLSVTYRGYKFWEWEGLNGWTELLSGWVSGTPGDYLEDSLGFQNMKNKIFIDQSTVSIMLIHSHKNIDVVPFFDTDIDKYAGGGDYQPFQDSDGFNYVVHSEKVNSEHGCSGSGGYRWKYSKNPDFPSSRNDFYDIDAEILYLYNTEVCKKFTVENAPGWLADSTGNSAVQYHFVRASLKDNESFECTESRSPTNTGGVWTKCGDNFTAFLEAEVPRPPTCDNPKISPPCLLDAKTITKAKQIFNNTVNNQL